MVNKCKQWKSVSPHTCAFDKTYHMYVYNCLHTMTGNYQGYSSKETTNDTWLVVWTPLKNMSSSIGMIIPNIWENKSHVPVTTNQVSNPAISCIAFCFIMGTCPWLEKQRPEAESKMANMAMAMVGKIIRWVDFHGIPWLCVFSHGWKPSIQLYSLCCWG